MHVIDWFTVGAQALNFINSGVVAEALSLQPILIAVDARRTGSPPQLADADSKRAEAQKERDVFQQKNERLTSTRRSLSRARGGKRRRQRLLDDARNCRRRLGRQTSRGACKTTAINLNQAIRRRTQQEVFAIARKALADLASTSLEESMIEVFIRRFGVDERQGKSGLWQSSEATSEPVLVRSAMELPEAQRSTLQKVLNETFSANVQVRFETHPISSVGSNYRERAKDCLSIADYLASLETASASF